MIVRVPSRSIDHIRSKTHLCFLLFHIVFLSYNCLVDAHGRLIEPPSRASAWRYGFQTPPDYNDHELYCGGFTRQWKRNGGKCGECGDAWDLSEPRPHENGGQWGQGVIVRSYFPSSEIAIRVELTASHMGYFEFRLCPKPSAKQSCLDENLLEIISGSPLVRSTTDLDTRFYPRNGSRIYEIKAQLPEILCNQCVLQWRYIAGNNWGICDDGNGAVGCGPQEEFRSCSDIAITTDARLPIRPARPTTRITTHHQSPKKDQVDANNLSVGPEIFITCLALILLFIGILIWVVYKNYPHRVAEWKQFLLRKLCKKDEVNSSRVIQSPTNAFNTILSIDDIGKSKDNSRVDHLSNLQISITPIPPPRTKRVTVTRVKENTNI